MFKENISKEDLAELPLSSFEGEIILVEDYDVMMDAVKYLRTFSAIGFDTETKPSFKRGQVNQVALLQLSTNDKAFLFRLKKLGLPNELKELMVDSSIQKVGVAIRDDVKALQKLNYFEAGGFVELQDEVKDFGIQNFSLKKMAGIVLGVRISKSQRLTNWEATLSEAQQNYAATDAWVALEIYQSLVAAQS
ncbi:3'-5' exonuclease [Sunxiuqinia sp. A32]|uniref:3'-5' exonuclease n=1 Tax=Sunxiuqinia sp. A32 TaxID=3461496 RepID=UPI0040452B44